MDVEIINFNLIGKPEIGYISIAEIKKNIPFEIKRVFWTYYTPHNIVRGRHAHFKTIQILIAVSGKIIVHTEQRGIKKKITLDSPEKGVVIPPDTWHTMEYSHDAVQLVLASELYDEKDYIRDYNEFKKVYK